MIPKRVHQIWIGADPELEWMNQWRLLCDQHGWDYRLWTEKDLGWWFQNEEAYAWYYQRKHYPGAADVARVEILHREGGWFIDADAELVDPEGFFNHPMHEGGFVCAHHLYHPLRYINGMVGSEPNHPITARYLGIIGQLWEAKTLLPAWNTVGGTSLYRAVEEAGGATIVPMRTFIDQHFGVPVPGDQPNLMRHYQHSTLKSKGARRVGGGSGGRQIQT